MNTFEKLLNEANLNNVSVIERYDFSGTRIKGLYCDGNIALSSELDTSDMKACILAEELGHHYTSTGNIIDQTFIGNRKQELHAKAWAYDRMIGLNGIITCYKNGCNCKQDIIDFLNITDKFLSDAIKYYLEKYGCFTTFENYVIYFQPLGVLELYNKN